MSLVNRQSIHQYKTSKMLDWSSVQGFLDGSLRARCQCLDVISRFNVFVSLAITAYDALNSPEPRFSCGSCRTTHVTPASMANSPSTGSKSQCWLEMWNTSTPSGVSFER